MRADFNAYREPRKVREGCQHQLGCKCDPPLWLRASTPAEEATTAILRPHVADELDYERLKGFAP